MEDINFFASLQRLNRVYQNIIELSCPNVEEEKIEITGGSSSTVLNSAP
jgi:hypothetical protein